jgi:hypothetical protein
VQASFKAEEGGIRDLGLLRAAAREADGSNSRYEEPEAEGISPVLRTRGNYHGLVGILGCREGSSSLHTDFP